MISGSKFGAESDSFCMLTSVPFSSCVIKILRLLLIKKGKFCHMGGAKGNISSNILVAGMCPPHAVTEPMSVGRQPKLTSSGAAIVTAVMELYCTAAQQCDAVQPTCHT